MRKFFFLLFISLASLSFVYAEEAPLNAGFVQGIWYSKFPFFVGDSVRIYAGIQNRSGFDIVGTVSFVGDGIEIGTADFSAINGRFIEVWTDWKPNIGTKNISAKIQKAFKSEAGKIPEPITLGNAEVPADPILVDTDADKNGIGDSTDKKEGRDPSKKVVTASSTLASVTEAVEDAVARAKAIELPKEQVEKINNSLGGIDSFMQGLSKKLTETSATEISKLADPTVPSNTVKAYSGALDVLAYLFKTWKWVAIFGLLCIVVLWTRRARRSKYADFDFS